MKINLVYHSPKFLGSGYMGSEGLYNAFKRSGHLHHALNTTPGVMFFDKEALNKYPIFYVRGMLISREPIVARTSQQFKACWQSESYYTRHGELDNSTPLMLKNEENFQMIFTCADTDLELYNIPTYWLPSWADTTVLDEKGKPELEGLGFIGGTKGREDFLNQDSKGIINIHEAPLMDNAYNTAVRYAEEMSKFKMLVSPPGRCYNGMCGRAWEIMACNRLCFQYYNEDTMYKSIKYFKDGVDIVLFKTYDELVEKYNYYLKHEKEASAVAYNGYRNVRKFHTPDVRVKYIVKCMEIEYEKWLKDQEKVPDWVDDIYEEMGIT